MTLGHLFFFLAILKGQFVYQRLFVNVMFSQIKFYLLRKSRHVSSLVSFCLYVQHVLLMCGQASKTALFLSANILLLSLIPVTYVHFLTCKEKYILYSTLLWSDGTLEYKINTNLSIKFQSYSTIILGFFFKKEKALFISISIYVWICVQMWYVFVLVNVP